MIYSFAQNNNSVFATLDDARIVEIYRAANGNVAGQVYNPDGTTSIASWTISTRVAGYDVTALDSGGFAVLWEDTSASVGWVADNDIRLNVYTGTGSAVTLNNRVHSYTDYGQVRPSLTQTSDGTLYVTWAEISLAPDDGASVWGRSLSATGTPLQPAIMLHDPLYGYQTSPAASALPNGTVFVGWIDAGPDLNTGNDLTVHYSVVDPVENLVISTGDISTAPNVTISDFQVVALEGGNTAVIWEQYSSAAGYSVIYQIVAFDGVLQGPQVTLGAGTSRDPVSIETATGGTLSWLNTTTNQTVMTQLAIDWNDDNTLLGTNWIDVLDGGPGADRMAGGSGHDRYIVDNTGDTIIELLNGGDDRVISSVNFALRDHGAHLESLTLTGIADLEGAGNGRANSILGNGGNNTLYGGGGNDTLSGAAGNDVLWGDANADRLLGGEGENTLYGGAGFDFLLGGSGRDSLDGGTGNDVLDGDDGDDFVNGGSGSDDVFGNAGNDTMFGGFGFDSVDGGNGNDWMDGGLGSDTMIGGNGADTLYGNAGSDVLHGADQDDMLAGQGGNDILFGGSGNDTLSGGYNNDTLSGGAGDDVLTGDLGADVFVFAHNVGNDTVTDFRHNVDRADYSDFTGISTFTEWLGSSSQVGADVVTASGGHVTTFEGVLLDRFDAADFIF